MARRGGAGPTIGKGERAALQLRFCPLCVGSLVWLLCPGLLVQTLVLCGVTGGNGKQNSGEMTPSQPHS